MEIATVQSNEVQIPALPHDQVELVSIRSHYERCIRSFIQLYHFLNLETADKQLFPASILSTELGRFRMWAGNTGAHRTGRVSLDHRLREVPDIHEEISELLEELSSNLGEAYNLTVHNDSGSLNQWEFSLEDEGVPSASEPMDADSPPQSDGFITLINDIAHIITCLYKLFITIRNPVPRDMLHKLASIDVSHFEFWDIQHILNKFRLAPDFLIRRLGKANTKRRQLLKYHQQHHDTIARYVDLPPQDDLEPLQLRKPKRNYSEIDDPYLKAKGPGTVSTTLKSQTTVSTIKPKEVRPVIHEGGSDAGHSQTSYATSIDSTHVRSIHVPPPPGFDVAYDGQPFECPYCFTLITLDNMRSWRKHVFRDLQPYVCTHKSCRSEDILFESQHDWYDHELHAHLREWYCRTCARPFTSGSRFKAHLLTMHRDIVGDELNVDAMVELGERAIAPPQACELCGSAVPKGIRRRHLSRHLQEIALFALPKVGGRDEETEGKEQTVRAQDTKTESSELDFNSSPTRESSSRSDGPTPMVTHNYTSQNQAYEEDISFSPPKLGAEEGISVQYIAQLHHAAENGHLEQVIDICKRYQHIVNLGFESAEGNQYGYIPLHRASQHGHANIVNFLLSSGSDVNKQCLNGDTPLICAVRWGHLDVARLLLENGADPNIQNHMGADSLASMHLSTPNRTAIEEAIKDALRKRMSKNSPDENEFLREIPERERQDRENEIGGNLQLVEVAGKLINVDVVIQILTERMMKNSDPVAVNQLRQDLLLAGNADTPDPVVTVCRRKVVSIWQSMTPQAQLQQALQIPNGVIQPPLARASGGGTQIHMGEDRMQAGDSGAIGGDRVGNLQLQLLSTVTAKNTERAGVEQDRTRTEDTEKREESGMVGEDGDGSSMQPQVLEWQMPQIHCPIYDCARSPSGGTSFNQTSSLFRHLRNVHKLNVPLGSSLRGWFIDQGYNPDLFITPGYHRETDQARAPT